MAQALRKKFILPKKEIFAARLSGEVDFSVI